MSDVGAARVAGIYAAFALAWVFLSDRVLDLLARNHEIYVKYSTYKGVLFVILTGSLLYLLVRSQLISLVRARDIEASIAEAVSFSKERQQLAFDAAQLGFWTFDLTDDTIRCDDRACLHFNVAPIVSSAVFLEQVHPDDHVRAQHGKDVMLQGGSAGYVEYRTRSPEGGWRWIALNARVEYAEGGQRAVRALGTSQDITERKNAEQALIEAEHDLRRAQAVTQTGNWRLDIASGRLRWSDETYRIFRIERGRAIDLRLFTSCVHPLDRSAVEQAWRKALHREPYDVEHRIVVGEDIRWVRERAEIEWSGERAVTAFGTVQDITERKRSEAALRVSEERLRYVMAATGDGVWDWSITAGAVTHNAQWCRMFGLDDSYLEHPIEKFIDLVHPEDRVRVQAAIAPSLASGLPYLSEHRMRRSDGKHVWVQDRGNVVERDALGEAIRMVGSVVDITERKEAEARQAELLADLRRSESEARQQRALSDSIFECTPDGMVLADLDRIIVNINPAFTEIFGYTLDDLRGLPSRILYATQQDCDVVGAHIDSNVNGVIVQPLNFRRKTGEVFPVQMTGARMLGPGGKVVGFLGVIRDISLDQKRDQAMREKQRLEALGRLTGGIAHDFNNLLTVISGNLQLVDLDMEDARLKRHLAEAYRATEMGARLNQRLMTFARQRRLDAQRLDLNDLVRSMLDLVNRSVGESIRVVIDLARRPAMVQVDASEMENAILNLALNARDAMPAGGQLLLATSIIAMDTATASVSGGVSPGPYVRLVVSDTGSGMSPEVQARAFEPFFTTKEEGKGTGLGLTTIHGFIRQSGGNVALYSEVGHGTTVNVYLPALLDAVAALPSSEVRAPVVAGHGERILLVEDNPAVRKITSDRLSLLGYRVLAAQSGAEALEILARGEPIDLVFSDIIMPGGVSGFDLARRLRESRPELPVLLTSGFAHEMSRPDEDDGEMPQILRKPYGQDDLAREIGATMKRHQTAKQAPPLSGGPALSSPASCRSSECSGA